MPARLTIDAVQEFIGDNVYDPYGRVVGRLVSPDSDVDGTLLSVAVEDEHREIRFIDGRALRLEDGKLVAWPEWKVLAAEVISNYQRALKRIRGLDEMYSRNEVPSAIYHEMRKKLSKKIDEIKQKANKLKTMIVDRMHEIEDANLSLDRAIANLKMSYLAGELSEKAYKSAIEMLRSAKDSNARELEDLKATKAKLESLESGAAAAMRIAQPKHEERPAAEKEEQPAAKPSLPAPSAETIQPIPVKLIEG
jgi:hypothetical protein